MRSDPFQELKQYIHQRAAELGFDGVGFTDVSLNDYTPRLRSWLDNGYHAEMGWMKQRLALRADPTKLMENSVSVISFRINYLPHDTQPLQILKSPEKAYISRYALGRDYHKHIRKKLAKIGEEIRDWSDQEIGIRAFVDSAPVLEKPLAEKAGLGWIGKNTLLLNREAGSWFFLGELITTLPLAEENETAEDHCGKCKACLKICPTDAFPKPYQLDARKCISYLTIEHKGSIPEELRSKMGNRVFGCDDCQLICPWNRYAKHNEEDDFKPRHQLDSAELVNIFAWNEEEFLRKTAGSPIRRIGYQRWLRNLAVGIGNGPASSEALHALESANTQSELVREHTHWAIKNLETTTP